MVALTDHAVEARGSPANLAELSKRQDTSLICLEQLSSSNGVRAWFEVVNVA